MKPINLLNFLVTTSLTIFFVLLALGNIIYAQTNTGVPNTEGTTGVPLTETPKSISSVSINPTNPFAFKTVAELVNKILDIVVKIGTVLALFFLIFAGFKYVTAMGDETKIKDAHKTFLTVIIGVAIVLGAKAISVLLQGTVDNIIK